MRAYPDARHAPPPARYYSARYTHWWVHPYYRWVHATVAVVTFNYAVHAWLYDWTPPARAGWVWVPGHYDGWWVPGHWMPAGPAPSSWGSHWVYVPGWWVGDTYIEGYWRIPTRGASWSWVEGHWTADGTYVWGHWEPKAQAPAGYVWEAGYWDGGEWVEGFWRPAMRKGYRWVSAAYDTDGVYEGGYWEPMEDRSGSTWIPGWFDGNEWVDGYWVTDSEYSSANPDTWAPAPGLEDGWDDAPAAPSSSDEQPLALPVSP